MRTLVALLLACFLLSAVSASGDKCTGAKLKAIGKKESGLLSCQSKVAATNQRVAPAPQ